jgi:Flp pilus assembly protein CpaB
MRAIRFVYLCIAAFAAGVLVLIAFSIWVARA